MLQQLLELLGRAVAAIAGIAVTSTTVAASTGVAVTNTKVSAIGGLAVTDTKVAAIAGIAVLTRCGRGWILPFIAVAADTGCCR